MHTIIIFPLHNVRGNMAWNAQAQPHRPRVEIPQSDIFLRKPTLPPQRSSAFHGAGAPPPLPPSTYTSATASFPAYPPLPPRATQQSASSAAARYSQPPPLPPQNFTPTSDVHQPPPRYNNDQTSGDFSSPHQQPPP